jgi:CHAT domain-containing protein
MHLNSLLNRGMIAALLALVPVRSAHAQAPGAARVLEAGKTIEDVLPPDQTRSFQIGISAGEYLRITIEKANLNVAARVLGPDGAEEMVVNSAEGGYPEIAFSLVSRGGNYQLEIHRIGKSDAEGNYRVSASAARPALPEDEKRASAERAYAHGEQRKDDFSIDVLHQRLGQYETALSLWHELADGEQEAVTRSRIGGVYANLSQPTKALEYLLKALPAIRAAGDQRAEAFTLHAIGASYANRGDLAKALEYQQGELLLSQKLGDKARQAAALQNIGNTYGKMGDNTRSLDYYRRSLVLWRALGNRGNEAEALHHIGCVYIDSGEPQKGLDYLLNQALPLRRAVGNHRREALTLQVIGVAYDQLGDPQNAQDYYRQALSTARTYKDKSQEAEARAHLGEHYLLLNEPERALEYLNPALFVRRQLEDRLGEATTLYLLGTAYRELGEMRKALAQQQYALRLYDAMSNHAGGVEVYLEMGAIYSALHEPQLAVKYYNRARVYASANPDMNDEALALLGLGSVYTSMGYVRTSLQYLNRAYQLVHAREPMTEAGVLYELARAERSAHHLSTALDHVNAALGLTEHLRGAIPSSDVRASYLASVRERYELKIALLMQLQRLHPTEDFDAQALEASEHARVRSLLDVLAESPADIHQGVEPELLERERSLQTALKAKAGYRIQLLSDKHTEQQASDLEKEISTLTTEYEETEAQIRERSPRYAGLTQPQTLTLAEIQHLLDPDTTLLEYWLGEEGSYLWVVTPNSLESYSLPKRTEIESAARKAYAELSVNNPAAGNAFTLALGRMLLSPIAQSVHGKRLVIVAEGTLQYIPFAALRAAQTVPLISTNEVVALPSISTLALQRAEMKDRIPAPRQVAVLADPVFHRNDPRVAGVSGDVPADVIANDRLERSAKESGLMSLDRLPATRREAEAIIGVAGKDSSLEALDFDASLETAISAELSRYRIVHFASHTLLNSRHPELSGIILSLVDHKGKPQDGFLEAHEIYNLKLNADLVVLSACETALGKEIRGEGLVGLARAFMYAGAPRVVATLWRVPDSATAELMKQFYTGIVKQDLPPAAALRQAQVSLSKDKRWSAPYYWAGFTLQGDWK